MSYIHVEAVNARNAELRRVAERDRRHRVTRRAHAAHRPTATQRSARRVRAAVALVLGGAEA